MTDSQEHAQSPSLLTTPLVFALADRAHDVRESFAAVLLLRVRRRILEHQVQGTGDDAHVDEDQ